MSTMLYCAAMSTAKVHLMKHIKEEAVNLEGDEPFKETEESVMGNYLNLNTNVILDTTSEFLSEWGWGDKAPLI